MVKTEKETERATSPLVGKELLKKLKELSHLSRKETAIACGYYTTTKDNQMRVYLTKFLEAVVKAKGIPLDEDGSKDSRGRSATYRACVHKNGQLVIGANYTEVMGLKPGDEFSIQLGHKHIHLKQITSNSEEENTQEKEKEEE
ncbi:MAG: AbrB family transcriptional regulator [Okeania sp. SIO2H7]|nr:AbrB family transcriptional regulator [Okeania sp. SIO2H7]